MTSPRTRSTRFPACPVIAGRAPAALRPASRLWDTRRVSVPPYSLRNGRTRGGAVTWVVAHRFPTTVAPFLSRSSER